MVGTNFGGTQTTYDYNGDDVLTKQTTGGVVTTYTQDLATPLSQILSDGTQTYIYGQERLYAQAGTAKTWYTSDALGSVRHTLDSAGSLSAPVRYDPFGNATGGSTPTFGFTGELTDASGYLYLRARRYDPNVGSFTSRDPMMGQAGQPSSFNQYQYAYGDPVLNGDPSGLFCVQINATYTFGTTCQHDSILGSSAPVRFAGGVVGAGLDAGRAIGEPFTGEGRATLWRGTQAIWFAPQQSWDALADYYGEQLGLAGLGARSLVNHPFCTLGTLSAEDWGAIAFSVASTYTGIRGVIRGIQKPTVVVAEAETTGIASRLPQFTFRGSDVSPEVVFREGFQARGTSGNLYDYAAYNEESIYVGTSRSPVIAAERFAPRTGDGYVYTVRPRGPKGSGVDVNETLGSRSPHPDELEVAVPGGIEVGDIMGARKVGPDGRLIGPFIPNPNFQP